jgi:hypothetical protein
MEKYEQTDRETEKQLKEAIRSAEKQLKMAMADYHKYILKGHYITSLKKYAGKQIKKIGLVTTDNKIIYFTSSDFEIIEVNDEGYFHISDWNWGLVEFNHKKKIYEKMFYGFVETFEIKGFFDIKINKELC